MQPEGCSFERDNDIFAENGSCSMTLTPAKSRRDPIR